MNSQSFYFCSMIKLLIIAIAFQKTNSIQLEDIAEVCSGNFITQDYNTTWETSGSDTTQTFWVPLASKSFVYHMMQNFYKAQDFNYLTQSHLENSCISVTKPNRFGWDLSDVKGYDDNSFQLQMIRTEIPKLFRFRFPYPNEGLSGYASIALSNNRDFNVFDFCFDNGLRSFALFSTHRLMTAEEIAVITAHMKSLGFKEKHFVNVEVNPTCPDISLEDPPKPAPPSVHRYPKYFFSNSWLIPSYFWKKK
ncbi:unnamed protein product [Orchesella dallaii]|uniref:Uncharacterized protein n=1 Tax=Orchesella dallaii TaxID=48710 RepID=A0ABP1S791_9HEXA